METPIMTRPTIPHNAIILVGDGRKALFLRNDGDETFMNLKLEQVYEHDNPPTHAQGSEGPGRVSKAAYSAQRSAVEAVDWHDLEENRFARKVAADLEKLVLERKTRAIVVIAPPRTLAVLREAFHHDVQKCIVAELHKDLTKHPVMEIEKHLTEDL